MGQPWERTSKPEDSCARLLRWTLRSGKRSAAGPSSKRICCSSRARTLPPVGAMIKVFLDDGLDARDLA